MAARAVKEAKKRHAEVHLLYLRPYHPAERPDETPDGFDGSLYPPGMERVPRRLAIVRANRYMVDHCDFLCPMKKHVFSITYSPLYLLHIAVPVGRHIS